MILAALSLAFVAQQGAETVTAIVPDDPETWVVEYPVRVSPYVESYYNCLKQGPYVIGDDSTFEQQHREAIPRCAKIGAQMEREANATLERANATKSASPEQIASVFETIRVIHVARGMDLDNAVRTRITAAPKPRFVPVEGNDAEAAAARQACLAKVDALTTARDEYAQEQMALLKPIYAKEEYTDEDLRAIASYRAGLGRYSEWLFLARRDCPADAS